MAEWLLYAFVHVSSLDKPHLLCALAWV